MRSCLRPCYTTHEASIYSEVHAKLYNLPILNPSIADNQYNHSSFVVLGLTCKAEIIKDKTLLSFTIGHQQREQQFENLAQIKDQIYQLSHQRATVLDITQHKYLGQQISNSDQEVQMINNGMIDNNQRQSTQNQTELVQLLADIIR
ncbi:hypothetical protein L0F63_003905 [Massospora cicadina]|nr:hypothetical protein L0F63_003905 [Massospora cicadina]